MNLKLLKYNLTTAVTLTTALWVVEENPQAKQKIMETTAPIEKVLQVSKQNANYIIKSSIQKSFPQLTEELETAELNYNEKIQRQIASEVKLLDGRSHIIESKEKIVRTEPSVVKNFIAETTNAVVEKIDKKIEEVESYFGGYYHAVDETTKKKKYYGPDGEISDKEYKKYQQESVANQENLNPVESNPETKNPNSTEPNPIAEETQLPTNNGEIPTPPINQEPINIAQPNPAATVNNTNSQSSTNNSSPTLIVSDINLNADEDSNFIVNLSYNYPAVVADSCSINSNANLQVVTNCHCVSGICTAVLKGNQDFYGMSIVNFSIRSGTQSKSANATVNIFGVEDATVVEAPSTITTYSGENKKIYINLSDVDTNVNCSQVVLESTALTNYDYTISGENDHWK